MSKSPSKEPETAPLVAIVIPMKDEADNLPGLFEEIDQALAGRWPFEVVAVDDGSEDATRDVLRMEMTRWPWLKARGHRACAGKSAAIRTGAAATGARFIVTMDGDGQNNPADVPAMIDKLLDESRPVALVCAERTGRTDSGLKRMASKLANRVRGSLLGDNTRDTANGLKAMRRDVYLTLPFFDTMHRFFPALVAREGLGVGHIDVIDRSRRHGTSKYGIWDRLAVGVPDLFGALWLRRRRKVVPVIEEIEK
ncbi:MAG: glycosyltransferase family 2 protein [Rhodobiaceae bacterium]|nr:glycosyltransferase family 2 protein [Rhodobiaceae bacterium]